MREIEQLQKQWRDGARARGLHASLHLADEGIVLGATVVAGRRADGALALDGDEMRLLTLLSVAHGRALGVSVLKALGRASDCAKAGNACMSSMHMALALPVLDDASEAARKLFIAAGLMAKGIRPRDIWTALAFESEAFDAAAKAYNPNQPRVPAGSGQTSGQWAVNWSNASALPFDATNRLATDVLGHATEADTDGGAERDESANTPGRVTADQLRAIMPQARRRDIDRMLGPLNDAMAAHGISTPSQMAAFLAQGAVESQNLRRLTENMNYTSVGAIRRAFPHQFPTDAAAAPYVRNPGVLGNAAYDGRNGNGTGEGYRYRGRGFLHVTGRNNYAAFGFADNPEALADPDNAAHVSARWWERAQLNAATAEPLARQQFLRQVTRRVNGPGEHQAADRWAAYQRALWVLDDQ